MLSVTRSKRFRHRALQAREVVSVRSVSGAHVPALSIARTQHRAPGTLAFHARHSLRPMTRGELVNLSFVHK